MTKYMEIAAEANTEAKILMDLVPAESKIAAAVCIAKLVNYGVRVSPRGVQSTVRKNAVTRAVQDLPVRITMSEVPTARGSYNRLDVIPVMGK